MIDSEDALREAMAELAPAENAAARRSWQDDLDDPLTSKGIQSIQDVVDLVAVETGLSVEDSRHTPRVRKITAARQDAMCRAHAAGFRSVDIAEFFKSRVWTVQEAIRLKKKRAA